jgi:hypothetical protein
MFNVKLTVPKHSGMDLDLPDERAACMLAQRIADNTGGAVTVHDEDGPPVATIHAQTPELN